MFVCPRAGGRQVGASAATGCRVQQKCQLARARGEAKQKCKLARARGGAQQKCKLARARGGAEGRSRSVSWCVRLFAQVCLPKGERGAAEM
eukprot:366045-Chlamydomonas_euryale.AAC.18